jgi:hypothetical protein
MSLFDATWTATEKPITINALHVLSIYQMDGYTNIMTTTSNGDRPFSIPVRERAEDIVGRARVALNK